MQPHPAVRFLAELPESGNVKRMTCKWIARQGAEDRQLKGIRDIFELAEGHAEWVNEMVTEAWAIVLDKQLWKVKYTNK